MITTWRTSLGTVSARLGDMDLARVMWDAGAMSRFIESILLRFPLPAFYFDAANEEHWQIVDGHQRLSALRKFAAQELALTGLEFLKDLNGKRYDDLDRTIRRRIAETAVNVHLISDESPETVRSLVARIHYGVTRGGVSWGAA